MLGIRFCLKRSTLGLLLIDERLEFVTIPKNAAVEVAGHCEDQRMIEVIWERKRVRMFLQDIRERGEEMLCRSVCGAGGAGG